MQVQESVPKMYPVLRETQVKFVVSQKSSLSEVSQQSVDKVKSTSKEEGTSPRDYHQQKQKQKKKKKNKDKKK